MILRATPVGAKFPLRRERTPAWFRMAEQDLRSAELTNIGVSLSLNAQLAFVGQLISGLIASRVLSRDQAVELINKVADTITSSLDQPASDLQAITNKPIQEHAEALRKLAADLGR